MPAWILEAIEDWDAKRAMTEAKKEVMGTKRNQRAEKKTSVAHHAERTGTATPREIPTTPLLGGREIRARIRNDTKDDCRALTGERK